MTNIEWKRKIRVVEYSDDWPQRFTEETALLQKIFRDSVVLYHHVGSTAIPGIYAKPIIDILAETEDIDSIDMFNVRMVENGYIPKGEFGITGRRFFIKGSEIERSHHLHIFQTGHEQIIQQLGFRNYLIAHKNKMVYYSSLKRRLAREYPDDIEAYMQGKEEFIKKILSKQTT